jgi:hypothetical protein
MTNDLVVGATMQSAMKPYIKCSGPVPRMVENRMLGEIVANNIPQGLEDSGNATRE